MEILNTPGVYIKELQTLPASIAAVETAIPAFIGHTEKANEDPNSVPGDNKLLQVPTRITSMLEYEAHFGGANKEVPRVTVTDRYNGVDGQPAAMIDRVVKVEQPVAVSAFKMYHSLQMYFANGGGPCYIVSVNGYGGAVTAGDETTFTSLRGGLAILEKVDEPTLIVFPDYLSVANYKSVYDAALAQCEKLADRFVVMDVKDNSISPLNDVKEFRDNGIGMGNLKYGAVYYPNIKTSLNYRYDATLPITHNKTYIGTGAPNPAIPVSNTPALNSLEGSDPSLFRAVEAELRKLYLDLPPSGSVAGIYARVDAQRGVWKAPANVDVRNVIEPKVKVTHEQQGSLNVDPSSGKSVNVIRTFAGKGPLVWGARTLAGNDNEWRYIPVRRLYIFIEESVKKATEFVVFEPNDANTWLRVKTMIENFLSKLWRDGALAGAKTDDAFFVKVGLGQTMNALDILEGRMNVEIGLAAVRPAEFIILKFSHKLQQS
ncbi:MAG: phage tail sheath family protein [Bacteroidia bacterium]|nr:phage tail sheath family protein [Bacteroidia bacterium]